MDDNKQGNNKNNKTTIIIIAVLAVLIIIGLILFLTLGRKVTVSFNTDGGTPIEAVTIKKGSLVSKPADPEKEGYGLVCWTLDGNEYNFDNNVDRDITLVAKWYEKIMVTYMVNGELYKTEEAVDGYVVLPEDPQLDGFVFNGWQKDGEFFYDHTAVTESVTLEADLIKLYTVVFMVEDSEYKVVQTCEGEPVSMPASPEKADYKFVGWQKGGKDYKADTPVTSDMTLTANFRKYVKISSISFGEKEYTVIKGQSVQTTLNIKPDNWAESMVYNSGNPGIATVDKNGNVTGVKKGKTTVTVTTESGKSATCSIKVGSQLDHISNYTLTMSLEVNGNSEGIRFTPVPEDADYTVSYSSQDKNVCTVDKDGYVRPVHGGKTNVYVTLISYGKTVIHEVTVYVNEYKLTATLDGYNPGDKGFYLWYDASDRPMLKIKATLEYYHNGAKKYKDVSNEVSVTGNAGKYISCNKSGELYATSFAGLDEGYNQFHSYQIQLAYKVDSVTSIKTGTFQMYLEPQLSFKFVGERDSKYSNGVVTLPSGMTFWTFTTEMNQQTSVTHSGVSMIAHKQYSNPKRDFYNWSFTRESEGQTATITFRTEGGQVLKVKVK